MKKILLALILGSFCLSANAHDEYYVPDVNPTFQINVYNEGETILDSQDEPLTSEYTMSENQREALLDAAKTWNNILKTPPNPNKLPTYAITTMDDINAYTLRDYVQVEDSPYLLTQINALINNKTAVGGYPDINCNIVIGNGLIQDDPGWSYYTGPTALYHEDYPDLYYTVMHEMYHSLGLVSNSSMYIPGDDTYYFSENTSSPISLWDSGLRVYANYMNEPFDAAKIIAAAPGMSINTELFGTGTFDIYNYSPYFAGKETLKVLTGLDDTEENMQAYIFSKGCLKNYSVNIDPWSESKVLGLPVNPIEGGAELSHIELRNSSMSHQYYRNWTTLMEAELAVLKDLGYTNVELRDFFGKSYYLDNITDTFSTGYGEWNGTNYNGYSTITNGIGLHIYGNNDSITQNSNTLSVGKAAIGTRIDGTNDTYTLNNSLIDVKGDDSIGIAVTWGKGHNVNINSGSTVIASGKNGIGVSFDFGKNRLGALNNDKGSYSFYRFSLKENRTPSVETQGALIENFNVEGTVNGSKAAIYTSENAYVKNININDGAEINGDIVSKWNSVKSGINMVVQRKGPDGWHPVDKDNPEEIYFTNLNFSGASTINGNITGENDIKNTLDMKNIAGSTVNFNGEEINVNTLDNNGDINISKNAVIATVENSITGNGNLNVLSDASLGLSSNVTNIENAVNLNSAALDMINGSIGATTFSNLTLTGNNSMNVDVDIASKTADVIKFNDPDDLTVNPGANLNISGVNMMNAKAAQSYTDEKYYIPFISSANNNQNLLGAVTLANQPTVLTPIFKYKLGYTEDATQGGFLFSRGATKKYDSYNPAVVASSVAAQFGGYLTQLNSYDEAFRNLDMKMLMTREERQAMKMANLYASTVTPTVYSPTYLPEKDKAAWFRPYATFEKVGLKNGPKVENISYGSYFGGDSPMFSTKNGWDYQYSVYAGYNGSHQNYAGNSIYQNGGTLGATAIWYKNDFFTALTANVGAGVAEASTMYGSEDFPMLMTGVASKTGYNWELAKGKFIIQPSYLMSYSFVNTFDYTNAAGVRIDSNPLHAINITPGLKFIGNLKNGWQPYASVQMVWNIMDKTDFRANNVALPDMSVKPYVQYGVGIQKRWGERFTGFFQTMLRNGGRNGVALSLGFRWAIGK